MRACRYEALLLRGWLTATTWFDNVAVGEDEYRVLSRWMRSLVS